MPDPVPSRRDGDARDLLGLAWTAVPSLIAFALAALFLVSARSITGPEAVYPEALAVLVLVLGLVNLVRDGAAWRCGSGRAEGGEGGGEGVSGAGRRLVAFALTLAVAVSLLGPLGFFPAMIVVVVGSLLVFGVRRPLVLAVTVVLVIGWSYVLFARLLAVPFPPGVLGLT